MNNESKMQADDIEIDFEKNGKDIAGGRCEMIPFLYGYKNSIASVTLANHMCQLDPLPEPETPRDQLITEIQKDLEFPMPLFPDFQW